MHSNILATTRVLDQLTPCLQQEPSSSALHPDASKGSSECADINRVLKQDNVVCLYNMELEPAVVDNVTGKLSYGTAGKCRHVLWAVMCCGLSCMVGLPRYRDQAGYWTHRVHSDVGLVAT